MKRTRNAVRNVIFGGLLKGYQILVPFIMRTLLIRYLGMEYLLISQRGRWQYENCMDSNQESI